MRARMWRTTTKDHTASHEGNHRLRPSFCRPAATQQVQRITDIALLHSPVNLARPPTSRMPARKSPKGSWPRGPVAATRRPSLEAAMATLVEPPTSQASGPGGEASRDASRARWVSRSRGGWRSTSTNTSTHRLPSVAMSNSFTGATESAVLWRDAGRSAGGALAALPGVRAPRPDRGARLPAARLPGAPKGAATGLVCRSRAGERDGHAPVTCMGAARAGIDAMPSRQARRQE